MNLPRNTKDGFTLLEVVIALGIFFLCAFSILDLVSVNLRAARALKPAVIDVGSLAAELMLTNRLEEGIESGDFGNLYPGFHWTRETVQVATNGLFQVDFSIEKNGGQASDSSKMSILLYRPESQMRGAGGFRSQGGTR